MPRLFRLFVLVTLALVLLFLAHLILEPAPIPALGAVAGGLVACAFRANRGWLIGGTFLGLLAGACAHACSHFVEGRVESISQLSTHVAADAANGLGVAIVVLGITPDFRPAAVSTGKMMPRISLLSQTPEHFRALLEGI